jgi:hypothetical protein
MSRKIYIVSDSHGMMFHSGYYLDQNDFLTKDNNEVKEFNGVSFILRPRGSHTAYNLRAHDEFIRTALIDCSNQDEIWLLFGEIDVRYHIFWHHLTDDIPIDHSIDNSVIRYIDYISDLRQSYNIKVVSITPTCRINERFQDYTKGISTGGTMIDRRYMTEVFNAKLKYESQKRNIPFIDIYDLLVDPRDGFCKLDWMRPCTYPEEAMKGEKDLIHYWFIGDKVVEYLGLTG